jgi:hypothetical protein
MGFADLPGKPPFQEVKFGQLKKTESLAYKKQIVSKNSDKQKLESLKPEKNPENSSPLTNNWQTDK